MATKVGEIFVRVGADIAQFRKAMAEVASGVKTTASTLKSQLSDATPFNVFAENARRMGRALSESLSLATPIATGILGGVLAIGGALGGVATKAVSVASEFEQVEISLTTILGSAEKARALMKEIQEFAKETPFEFKSVVAATNALLAYGFAAKDVIPVLKAVGDASAGLSLGEEGLFRIIRALGQMRAKAKVSAEEMLQLTEAGIPAWEMLAKKIGKSIPEAMELARKGAIKADVAISALVEGMSAKFGGLMEKQAKTIPGVISNLKDTVDIGLSKIGEALIDAFDIKGRLSLLVEQVSKAFDRITAEVEKIKKLGIRKYFEEMVPPEVKTALQVLASVIGGALTVQFLNLLRLIPMIVASLASFSLYVGLFYLIAGAAYYIYKNWDQVKKTFEAVKVAVASFLRSAQFKSLSGAISSAVASAKEFGRAFVYFLKIAFDFLKAHGDDIKNILSGSLNAVVTLVKAVIRVVSGLLTLLAGVLTADAGKIARGAKVIANAVVSAIRSLIPSLVKILAGLSSIVLDLLNRAGTAILRSVAGLAKSLIQKFSSLNLSIPYIVGYLAGFLLRLFAILVARLVSIVASGVARLVRFFASLPVQVVKFIASLPARLADLFATMMRKAKGGAEAGAVSLWDFFRSLPRRILDYIASLPSRVYEGMKRVGRQLWLGFKAGAGIKSPSLVEKALTAMKETAYATVADLNRAMRAISETMKIPELNPAPMLASLDATIAGQPRPIEVIVRPTGGAERFVEFAVKKASIRWGR